MENTCRTTNSLIIYLLVSSLHVTIGEAIVKKLNSLFLHPMTQPIALLIICIPFNIMTVVYANHLSTIRTSVSELGYLNQLVHYLHDDYISQLSICSAFATVNDRTCKNVNHIVTLDAFRSFKSHHRV